MQQVKNALRQLHLRPALSLTVIVMLALGIGATTAMFSLFHQILIQPLPVPEPERLVNLRAPGPVRPGPVRSGPALQDWQTTFSYLMFRDLAAEQSAFTDIAAHRDFDANITYGRQTLSGRGMLVSGGYFGVLGLQPALGRLIAREDEPAIGESAVVVLGYDYWQSQFGGDRNVIGQTLMVNGHSLAIIGVAPAGFTGTTLGWRPQLFVPLTLRWLMQPTALRDHDDRNSYWLYLFARLKPNVSTEQAAAAVTTIYRRILTEEELPELTLMSDAQKAQFVAQSIVLEPGARGQTEVRGSAARPLTLLLGITSLLLLIVCVNVANLLLARGASRAPEMAIRASIGASRTRLVSQLLSESVVLAAIGGLLSLPLAALALRLIALMLPEQLAGALPIELSGSALLFAAAAAFITVLLFGSVPAWQASDADPARVMKGQAAQAAGHGLARFRGTLGAVQIAFALVLLVLAGLFAQSLANVARLNLGIDTDSLVSFSVAPRLNGYAPEHVDALYARIEEGLAAQPGVTSVASAGVPLIANDWFYVFLSVAGFEDRSALDRGVYTNIVSPRYFDTLSMPLLAGRDFTDAEMRNPYSAAIVNESFARKFDLGNPIGKRFGIPFVADSEIEIIGVVADAKFTDVKSDLEAQFFTPGRQLGDDTSLTFYVRGALDDDALLRTIPRVVADVDPDLPVNELTTMRKQVDDNVYIDRLITMLSASFAALATLLAAIGLYGVLAYNVATRTRELGLRLALGAQPADLRAMVLKQVGVMASVGGTIGLAAALGFGRAAEALLFGLPGYEPSVLIAATVVLALVVLAASYLPARRASSIAPMEALRYE